MIESLDIDRLFSYLVAALLLCLSVQTATAQTPEPTEPVVGFTINLHHTEHLDKYLESVDQIAKMGCNTLQVITPAWQHNGASAEVYYKPGPGGGPTRDQLLTLLGHAKKRGLRTALMVTVLLEKPRGSEWRGKIMPGDWDTWWQHYHRVIHQAMDVALEAKVDDFAVGSELLTTEPERERWAALIDSLRQRFDGRLYYSTNWDHYHVPRFWDKLDLIGINGYWNITTLADDPDQPTHDELVQRWRQIRHDLTAHARRFNKPILITEIGYPALPWALKDPWNYIANDAKPDPQAQARGYRAFLEAWSDALQNPEASQGSIRPEPQAQTQPASQPAPIDQPIAGVLFFKWDPYYSGGPNDTGYGVRGKPAFGLIKQWVADHNP